MNVYELTPHDAVEEPWTKIEPVERAEPATEVGSGEYNLDATCDREVYCARSERERMGAIMRVNELEAQLADWRSKAIQAEAREIRITKEWNEANTQLAEADKLAVHLQHCNFGEHAGGCKYGDSDCPALSDSWEWLGIQIQKIRHCDDCDAMMNPIGKGIFECWKCADEAQRVMSFKLRDRAEQAEAQLAEACHKIEHQRYWYGCRAERLHQFAREELSEPLRKRYFNIAANGTADPNEPPSYAQQYNWLKHRAEKAEADAARLRAALEEVEWVYDPTHGPNSECPWCRNVEDDGHKPDCARQLALSPESDAPAEEVKE